MRSLIRGKSSEAAATSAASELQSSPQRCPKRCAEHTVLPLYREKPGMPLTAHAGWLRLVLGQRLLDLGWWEHVLTGRVQPRTAPRWCAGDEATSIGQKHRRGPSDPSLLRSKVRESRRVM